MLQTKVIEKIKKNILYAITSPLQIVCFMRQCGKYDGDEQYTDDNVIRGIHFSRRLATA
jgi:hypothetical protein